MSSDPPPASSPPAITAAELRSTRRFVDVAAGSVAYLERGTGPASVFLHGVPLNGFHWRGVIPAVADLRRCIAIDLLGLGSTRAPADADLSFDAQAAMVVQVLDALALDRVDLVGNDSGGAIAQIVTARHPSRVRSLTLTNCDVHDMWPPDAVGPTMRSAQRGVLATRFRQMLADPTRARGERGLAIAYTDAATLTDEVVATYLAPLVADDVRVQQLHRYLTSFAVEQTVAIEPLLRQLDVPTLIVWGTDDVFFPVEHGRWLARTIPSTVELVLVPGARLFFAEEQPEALARPLRRFWTETAGRQTSA